MQDVLYATLVKGWFDTQRVKSYRLRTTDVESPRKRISMKPMSTLVRLEKILGVVRLGKLP